MLPWIKTTFIIDDMEKMAVTRKGLFLMIAGLVIMILGYVLMSGGSPQDPQVFNYEMFNTRRLVVAPLCILVGIAVIIVGIFSKPGKDESK